MELVTVGTGTVAPSATRTSACHWVSRARLKILLDCGPGALHRLAQFGLPWPEVTHVVLSHFHPDHWAELPMLVYALKYTTAPPRQEPLVILGPPGGVRLVKTLAEGYGEWLLDPGFPIGIPDVRASEGGRQGGRERRWRGGRGRRDGGGVAGEGGRVWRGPRRTRERVGGARGRGAATQPRFAAHAAAGTVANREKHDQVHVNNKQY